MEVIHKYFPDLTVQQIHQFSCLENLYRSWNSKINVISRKDIDSLYVNHVLHSLSIAKIINFRQGTKVLDLGTGGGFPGLPLAILFPEVDFLLIDSIRKKIRVVDEVVSAIGLVNVSTLCERAENLDDSFDFIVSRSVANIKELKKWGGRRFSNKHNNSLDNGMLCLKGGDLSEELNGILHQQYKISDFFEEEFFATKKVVHIAY